MNKRVAISAFAFMVCCLSYGQVKKPKAPKPPELPSISKPVINTNNLDAPPPPAPPELTPPPPPPLPPLHDNSALPPVQATPPPPPPRPYKYKKHKHTVDKYQLDDKRVLLPPDSPQ